MQTLARALIGWSTTYFMCHILQVWEESQNSLGYFFNACSIFSRQHKLRDFMAHGGRGECGNKQIVWLPWKPAGANDKRWVERKYFTGLIDQTQDHVVHFNGNCLLCSCSVASPKCPLFLFRFLLSVFDKWIREVHMKRTQGYTEYTTNPDELKMFRHYCMPGRVVAIEF